MNWGHRVLNHAERGVRRFGRAYHAGRGLAQRADRFIHRGMRVFDAISHMLPSENKKQIVKGLSTYNAIRAKALEADRSLQAAGIVR